MKETLIGELERVFDELCQLVFGDKLKTFLSDETIRKLEKNRRDGTVPFAAYCRPEFTRLVKNRVVNLDRIPTESLLIYRYPTRGLLVRAKRRGKYELTVVILVSHELRHRLQHKRKGIKLYTRDDFKKWILSKYRLKGKECHEKIFNSLRFPFDSFTAKDIDTDEDANYVCFMAGYSWIETQNLPRVAQIIKSEPK